MGASERYCLRWNNHQTNLISVMDDLLKNQTLTDVTLGVEDGRFLKCHKVILATCSPYFRTLFIEVPTNHPIILLKDVGYTEVKAILEFMYKGEVNVAYDDMAALFQVAELLQVKGLVAGNELSSGNEAAPSPSTTTNARGESSQTPKSRPPSRRNSTNSPGKTGSQEEPKIPPAWPMSQFFGSEDPRSAVAALANFHPFLPSQAFSFSQFHEEAAARSKNEGANGLGTSNQETPILRSVLNPELEERSRDSRGRRDGSIHSGDARDRRASFDFSQHSPRHSEHSMVDDDNQNVSQLYPEDPKYGTGSYTGSHRQEIKRYKKYSRKDIWNAIAAVKGGLSANKAAELFNVPSRTLYDKIKKLGIPPTKHRRSENLANPVQHESAPNANASPENVERNEEPIENPASIVEASLGEIRPKTEPDDEMEIVTKSPKTFHENSQPRSPANIDDQQLKIEPSEAEDLSVNRKSNIHVIVSAKSAIQETA